MSRIAIFASGGGSNFITIYNNTLNGEIENTEVVLLVSNNSHSNAVDFAKKNGIETFIINSIRYPSKKEYNNALKEKLLRMNLDLIVLAGYMKLIPASITSLFQDAIINIHPGKLPDFGGKGMYGLNVHQAVIRSKQAYTAVTVHYVNEKYDKGAIICEEKIKVLADDTPETLAARVLTYEHKMYSAAINDLLN